MCVCVFITVYYSLLKSIDLTNCEKAFKYLSTSSLFVRGQIPPLVVICCIKELLWGSSILHAWIRCSTDCSASLQGHIVLSVNTFTAVVDLSRFNNSCLKSPASTLVDLTFQSRALRSFSLNQLRNLSL